MKSRTRSRKPASIGSNPSSRRPTSISASEPRTGNFVLWLVMAWSPPAHNAGIVWVSAPGDYAPFNPNHPPDGTVDSLAMVPAHPDAVISRRAFRRRHVRVIARTAGRGGADVRSRADADFALTVRRCANRWRLAGWVGAEPTRAIWSFVLSAKSSLFLFIAKRLCRQSALCLRGARAVYTILARRYRMADAVDGMAGVRFRHGGEQQAMTQATPRSPRGVLAR